MKKIPDHATKVFEGVFFSVWQWEQELFDGSKKTFEYVSRPDVSTIIPVTPKGTLLLIEEEQPTEAKRFGFPSGTLEKGELKEDCAKRELLEETGYMSDDISHWYSAGAGLRAVCEYHIFIAKNCLKTSENLNIDPGERIKLFEITLEELLERAEEIKERNPSIYPELIKAKYSNEERQKLKELLGITT